MVLGDSVVGGEDERGLRDGWRRVRADEDEAGGRVPTLGGDQRGDAAADEARGTGGADLYDERFLVQEHTVCRSAAIASGRCGGIHGPDFFGGRLSGDV